MRLYTLPFLSGLLLVWALAGSSLGLAAQNQFTINGRFKVDGGTLEGARVVVYKNGQKDRTKTMDLSRFSMDLEMGQTYILSFEKPGYVTKKLSFDTRVPPSAAGNSFVPFEFSVALFKQYDDLNLVVFNQPVGMIRYDPGSDDFDYDTDYSKSIQSQLKEAMDKVEKKQAEERRTEATAARQQADADKEKARSEAEEQKRLAEKAKLEAVRQRTAEEEARREEQRRANEAVKAEAERKKTEEAQRKSPPAPVVKPPSPPPPAPPVAVERPAPKPVLPPTGKEPQVAQAGSGNDVRRSSQRVVGEDPPPSPPPAMDTPQPAPVVPSSPPAGPEADRFEELILEPGKVITVIRLVKGTRQTEYRRVSHKYGAVYYFRNGSPISREVYEQEALAGR